MTDKDRLEAFERMQREISEKYTSTSERLTALKAEGREIYILISRLIHPTIHCLVFFAKQQSLFHRRFFQTASLP